MQKKSTNQKKSGNYNSSGVAIIGMSGRFPGSKNSTELWENLIDQIDVITEIPKERWNWKDYFGDHRTEKNKTNSKWGGFLTDIDKYDAAFFRNSPKEAALMDPQQRLVMEETWRAIEDAGYKQSDLAGKNIGVFIGVCNNDYKTLLMEHDELSVHASTGGDFSVISNRISHFFDFNGPSIAIDTACSSSLVALHQAVKSIEVDGCDMAVSGGVNLCLTPKRYCTLAPFLSSDGRCKTFDESGNGYVRSEGVAVLLLKSLEGAVKDNDHIYAVIKGSAVNHDGQTNFLTTPNPNAHARLLVSAWEKSGIDPKTISYIETHGTGTRVGDPIEINGLKRTFQQLYEKWDYDDPKEPHCKLGSVKSNIGHLESAAGIAGVFKVLLAMKHKILPGNLHIKEINRYIELNDTPFSIVTKTQNWNTFMDDSGKEIPRRAGVSSFGYGGANAHIALEEYVPKLSHPIPESDQQLLILLSTKGKDQLKIVVRQLLDFLERQPETQLQDIAYTLQTGRESMAERLAIVTQNLNDLKEKLTRYLNEEETETVYYGKFKNNKSELPDSQKALVKEAIKKRDLHNLAKLWIKGQKPNWELLYSKQKPKRIALPTYPFVKKRHWLQHKQDTLNGSAKKKIHPLIGSNTSTLSEQKFTTVFTGEEFYLTDHVVADLKTLPGVAYLEMARAAGELATEQPITKLSHIVWAIPITEPNTPVHISLYPAQQDQVEFEVSTLKEDQERRVHTQGKLLFSNKVTENINFIDIEVLKNRCPNYWDAQKCYRKFQDNGLSYGPTFQTIRDLYYSEKEALSVLELPQTLNDCFEDFTLHPSIMDGALQTVVGLDQSNSPDPSLPFSLSEVELLGSLPDKCYVYVRRINEVDSLVKKFNISILDDKGIEKVRLSDFAIRTLKSDKAKQENLYCKHIWKKSELDESISNKKEPFDLTLLFDKDNSSYDSFKEKLDETFILVTPGKSYKKVDSQTYIIHPDKSNHYVKLLVDIKTHYNQLPDRVIHLWSQDAYSAKKVALNMQLSQSLFSVFYLSQAFFDQRPLKPIQFLYLYLDFGEIQPQYAALSAFTKSIHLEFSKLKFKIITVSDSERQTDIAVKESLLNGGTEIKYQSNQRFVKQLQEFDGTQQSSKITELKTEGVYIITGGAGGLGLIFAKYLAKQYNARLVLTGRSKLSHEKANTIKQLNQSDAKIIYRQTDISKASDVKDLIANTKADFGKINGIIHAAGVIKDALFFKKKTEEITSVLAPKLYGAVWLDEFTKNEPLDFMVFFSSIAASFGNTGQCDYAYANAFMDHFAEKREILCINKKRFGKIISINWPLWESGGMQIDEETEKILAGTTGMRAISNDLGWKVFNQALKHDKNQFIMISGNYSKLKKWMGFEVKVSKPTAKIPSSDIPQTDQLVKKFQPDILTMISEILKIDVEDIDLNDDISEYGFDSMDFTQLANKLNNQYELELTPTIFFEYPSISEFSDFLCLEHENQLANYYGSNIETTSATSEDTTIIREEVSTLVEETEIKLKSRFIPLPTTQQSIPSSTPIATTSNNTHTDIAIIGMSGIMPQSKNLEDFWQHLESGDDLISEVPINRWNWKMYYGSSQGINKTEAKWGGFIPDVDKFDSLFFGISPREAELMDPQQRLFLETVWKTIENAGYKASDLSGTKTGVFVGISTHDYDELVKKHRYEIEAFNSTGWAHSITANRVSYLLNLHGPSEPIDTACSSSLIAVHRAVEAISSGTCDTAIAGGVNLTLTPSLTISFSKAGMLSKDGRCKTFDERADGYVRGEGVGAVWLKPLEKAQNDGDIIHAVIKSTAENHGGRANSLTAPNPNAQAELLVDAYQKTGFDPATIGYIEAHGTGTSLGDPIEINGLKNAFTKLYEQSRKSLPEVPHCGIGSVKTHIGHLESAAGIAGIFKVLLSMKHKMLPGNLHFETLNPYVQLEGSPFYVVSENKQWEALTDHSGNKIPRRAGVSSFGFGGANAHVVLEEYEMQYNTANSVSSEQIVVLSAQNEERLKAYAEQILDFIDKNPKIQLADLTYTLQVGRESMPERLALLAKDIYELKEKLNGYIENQKSTDGLYLGNTKKNKTASALLIEGEAGEAFLKIVMDKKELARIAQLWTVGIEIDWKLLHIDQKPQRIAVPTYPFAKQRYWIDIMESKTIDVAARPIMYSETGLDKSSVNTDQPFTSLAQNSELLNITDEGMVLEKLQKDILAISAGILKIDAKEIDLSENLIDYGFNSISFVELSNAINKKYQLEITPSLFFDYPTIDEIGNFLYKEYLDILLDFYKNNSGSTHKVLTNGKAAVENERELAGLPN
ncbi:MAG: SDR family NAD(P)-dependent oxidoreductase [Flavobacteriaceae bacterium]|nr:MAG: SDR family NAD(P)-dependent oxidoreductase [Flavobacteriaceae bacterium]